MTCDRRVGLVVKPLDSIIRREAAFDERRLNELSRLVLQLYRGSRDWPRAAFQARAFESVNDVVPFDSGMWGTASNDPHAMHGVHLHRQPRAMIEQYIEVYQELDPVRQRAFDAPGTTVNFAEVMSREELCASRIYREFMSRWGVECVLCTALIEPVSSLMSVISLWRSNPRRPFNETERRAKQFLVPHLIDAYRENRLLHMRRSASPVADTRHASAICDCYGVVHQIEERCVALLKEEWPEWAPGRLPRALSEMLTADGPTENLYCGKKVAARMWHMEDLVLLEVRRRVALDRLSLRERRVAGLFSTGCTAPAIGVELGISESTVSNHLYTIYRKLAITNKVQLARLFANIGA